MLQQDVAAGGPVGALRGWMTSSLRRVRSEPVRKAFVYLVSFGLNASIPLMMLPVLAHYIAPASFGRYAILQALVAILGALVTTPVRSPLLRFLSVGNRAERPDYIASGLVFIAVMAALTVVAVVILDAFFPKAIGLSVRWSLAAIAICVALGIHTMNWTQLQADGHAYRFGFLQVAVTAATALLTLLLVIGFGMGWLGAACGVAGGAALGAGWALWRFFHLDLMGRPHLRHFREITAMALATIPHAFFGILLANGDRFFLSISMPLREVGVYAAASRLAAGYALIGMAANMAFAPWAMRRLDALEGPADARRLLKLALELSAIAGLGTLLFYGVTLLAYPVLLPPAYQVAIPYLPWMVAGAGFNFLYFIFVPPLFYYKRVWILGLSGLLVTSLGLAIVIHFSHLYGAMGVAMGVCAARFLLLIAVVTAATLLVRQHATALRKAEA